MIHTWHIQYMYIYICMIAMTTTDPSPYATQVFEGGQEQQRLLLMATPAAACRRCGCCCFGESEGGSKVGEERGSSSCRASHVTDSSSSSSSPGPPAVWECRARAAPPAAAECCGIIIFVINHFVAAACAKPGVHARAFHCYCMSPFADQPPFPLPRPPLAPAAKSAAAAAHPLAAFGTSNASQNMSSRASGGVVTRKRQRQVEEEDQPVSVQEDQPVSVQVAAHAEPLMLLSLVKSYHGALVCAQLCNPQGVSVFSFVRLPPHVSRPFAGAAMYGMSLTHAERLRALGCGLKGKLVRLLSLSMHCTTTSTATAATTAPTSSITTTTVTVCMITAHQTRYVEPHSSWRACHGMMQSCVRRVASKPMAAVRDEAAKEAEELCASGQCAAALAPLQRAIHMGHLPSRALKAWLLIDGREGIAEDQNETFDLAEEGARWGCHHCKGVLAYCYWGGYGCDEDKAASLKFARESSSSGSKYGQYVLGWSHQKGGGGVAVDYARAVAFYRLAAAQGLDEAQYELGDMYRHARIRHGCGVAEDHAEALRLYQLAAAQGYAQALFMVAYCRDRHSSETNAEAIRCYMRAHAAGHPLAAAEVRRLRAEVRWLRAEQRRLRA